MKEYRVINPKLGLSRRNEKLQEVLNQHAREGWCVNHITQGFTAIIFERDKIR